MKLKRLFILCLCLGLLGCGKEETVYPSEEAMQLFLEDYSQASSVFAEDALTIYYRASSDSIKQLLDVFLNKITYSKSEPAESTIQYSIVFPDVEKLTNEFLHSQAFAADSAKMEEVGKTKEEVEEYAIRSVTSFLEEGKYESITCDVKVNKFDAKLPSNAELVNAVKRSVTAITNFERKEPEEVVTGDESVSLNLPVADGAFVYSNKEARILVSDISIYRDEEALQKLREISDLNDVKYEGTLLYLVYTATNLSKKSTVVQSEFKGVSPEGYVLQCDYTFAGISDEALLKAGKSKEMSAVVILDDSSDLCWYDSAIRGSVRIK